MKAIDLIIRLQRLHPNTEILLEAEAGSHGEECVVYDPDIRLVSGYTHVEVREDESFEYLDFNVQRAHLYRDTFVVLLRKE